MSRCNLRTGGTRRRPGRAPPLLGAAPDAGDEVDAGDEIEPGNADGVVLHPSPEDHEGKGGDDFDNGALAERLASMAKPMLEVVAGIDALGAHMEGGIPSEPPPMPPPEHDPPHDLPHATFELDDRRVCWLKHGVTKRAIGKCRFWGDRMIEIKCFGHAKCFHHVNFRKHCDIAAAEAAAHRWLTLAYDSDRNLCPFDTHQQHRLDVGKNF